MLEKAEKRFLAHIRVLCFWIAFWIKRGYNSEKSEKRFLNHIRVLSFSIFSWIKRGYDSERLKNVFWPISAFYPFGYPKG